MTDELSERYLRQYGTLLPNFPAMHRGCCCDWDDWPKAMQREAETDDTYSELVAQLVHDFGEREFVDLWRKMLLQGNSTTLVREALRGRHSSRPAPAGARERRDADLQKIDPL